MPVGVRPVPDAASRRDGHADRIATILTVLADDPLQVSEGPRHIVEALHICRVGRAV